MNTRIREFLRLGRCGPISRQLALLAAHNPLPGRKLVAYALLGKPRHEKVEVEVERDGVRYLLDLREDAHRIMFLNFYERELRQRVMRLLPQGGTLVDVGANVGFWTIPAALRVGQSGKVIAVEPNPWAANRLRHNLDLNRSHHVLSEVHLVASALRDKSGSGDLMADDLILSASQATFHEGNETGREKQKVTVPVATLDQVVQEQIDVLKIDVEGDELAVLAGGKQLFSMFPPRFLVIEIHGGHLKRAGHLPADLISELIDLGYQPIDSDGDFHRRTNREVDEDFYQTVVWQFKGTCLNLRK